MDNGYLVTYYSTQDIKNAEVRLEVVRDISKLFKILDDAKEKGTLIVVDKIGETLIDWS